LIVKERTIPIRIQQNEALLDRLMPIHPKRDVIQEDLSKRRAGYRGECSVDYFLSFLPEKEYYIFYSLRLPYKDVYFQIDILIISPKRIILLEVKNIAGTVVFGDPFNQLIRIKDEVEEGFENPITQVRRQRFQLTKWLSKNNFPIPPIDYFVIFSNPSTIIKSTSNEPNLFNLVGHGNQILSKIENLERSAPVQPILDNRTIKRMGRQLQKQHTPHIPNALNNYGVPASAITMGVKCPDCSSIPMTRERGKWFCPSCQKSSKNAHLQSLNEYFLLFGPTITNRQAREFLLISSRTVASNLLADTNLQKEGSKRGSVYRFGHP
jgi:hypothetical protein